MMKKAAIILAGVLLMGIYVVGYQPSQAQLIGPPAPLKIAVVNVSKALSECKENLERQKLTQEKEQSLSQQLNTMQKQAEAIQAELEANVLKPGSVEYNNQFLKFVELNAQIQAFQEGQQQIFAVETQAWMEALYQKFLNEVVKVAQSQQYSVVLNYDESQVQMPDLNTLTNMIRSRKIVYRSAEIDITAVIMQNMDSAYEMTKIQSN